MATHIIRDLVESLGDLQQVEKIGIVLHFETEIHDFCISDFFPQAAHNLASDLIRMWIRDTFLQKVISDGYHMVVSNNTFDSSCFPSVIAV